MMFPIAMPMGLPSWRMTLYTIQEERRVERLRWISIENTKTWTRLQIYCTYQHQQRLGPYQRHRQQSWSDNIAKSHTWRPYWAAVRGRGLTYDEVAKPKQQTINQETLPFVPSSTTHIHPSWTRSRRKDRASWPDALYPMPTSGPLPQSCSRMHLRCRQPTSALTTISKERLQTETIITFYLIKGRAP